MKAPAPRFGRPRASLRQLTDERGAIALLGLFMAVFLTAAAYYVVGIGEAVLFRERMQDAADSAAFSAAVLHARGMNLLSLINMIMAALLAILVALKLVEAVASIAIVVIAIASVFGAPAAASAIPGLSQLRSQVKQAHDTLRPPIHRMLETLHAASVAVRAVVPIAAALRGSEIAATYPDTPIQRSAVLPPRLTLPTQDGTFAELCDRAGEYVAELSELAIASFIPAAVAEPVGDAMAELTSAGAGWFCGNGKKPSSTLTITARHPQLPSTRECERFDAAQPDYDAARHAQLCARAKRDEAASKPDRFTGACAEGCDPEVYLQRAGLARRDCAPRTGEDPLREFEWQQQRMQRSYVWTRSGWQLRAEQATGAPQLRKGNVRPCGHPGAAIGSDWTLSLHDPSRERLAPLCSSARAPTGAGYPGETRLIDYVEVTQLFGCKERIRRRYQPDGAQPADSDSGAADGSDQRVPQRLIDSADLGDDHFQIRAVIRGKAPPSAPAGVLAVAAWGHAPDPRSAQLGDAGATLGRLAAAQAEYFYAVNSPDYARSSLLWNMGWQARLRRFRAPEQSGDSGLLSADEWLRVCDVALLDLAKPGEAACTQLANYFDLLAH